MTNLAHSQDFSIKGRIVDTANDSPLEAATIYAETLRDSVLISYAITDAQGSFLLEGRTSHTKARLGISYNGYRSKALEVDLGALVELGSIGLEEQPLELGGVDLIADRVPLTIRQDTLEFNPDSFKTRPDATVEDVLKKLPGVEVASDGSITVNGKSVNKVLVDGQVFFSTDPKVATKSLSKDVIAKIQILDSKTKEQEFTGEDGDGENKTINLLLKEDKKQGYMGRFTGGYGTDDRYQANGLVNYFNKSQRISVLGSSNNINNPGFSFDEIYDMVGNQRGGISMNSSGGFAVGNLSFGFGDGIITSSTIGASYADQRKDRYKMDGNYFYSYSDSQNNEKIARENFLPNGRYFTVTENSFMGSTLSNQGSANLEFDVDRTTRVTIQPGLSVNNTDSGSGSNRATRDLQGNLVNDNSSRESSQGKQRNFSNRVEIMKRLDSLGRYVRLYFDNNNRINDSETFLESERNIYGDTPSQQLLDQWTSISSSNDRYEVGASYRHKWNKALYVDLRYGYENNSQKSQRSVRDFDPGSGDYLFNTALSSDFEFNTRTHAPEIALGANTEKVRFHASARWEGSRLENEDFIQGTHFSKDYGKLLLGTRFNYNMSSGKRLSLNYNARLNTPSVRQLQPVPDLSNPLNIVLGNPDLAPEVNHNIRLNFNNFNWRERTGFFVFSGMSFEEDKVVSNTSTDEDFVRTTTYENIGGNYNGWAGLNFSKQIKRDSLYTLKFTIHPYLNFGKQVGYSNGSRLEAKRLAFSPRVGLLFNFRELLEIEPEYALGINATRYNLDNVENIDYLTHSIGMKLTTYWPENLVWGNDLTYSYNSNVGDGFRKDAIFWNMSLGWQLFNKTATLKVLAYDLLDQNINTRRSTGQDYIQDFQGTVLNRYFMGSLTLKFDSFKGKGAPDQQGRGRRTFRIM